jgi:hypothetical protein
MSKPFCGALLGFSLLVATSSAFAATISFIEGPLETDPVAVTTNLVLTLPITVTSETAVVIGFHHPGISPSPISFVGSVSAGLFEPGSTTLLSDYVLLTASDIRQDPVFGLAQDLDIRFFSVDTLVSDLPTGFTFGGGVEEDGNLQDLSPFLGTLPEGLIVSVLSQPGPEQVPEPTSLLLLGSGLAVLAGGARKRHKK